MKNSTSVAGTALAMPLTQVDRQQAAEGGRGAAAASSATRLRIRGRGACGRGARHSSATPASSSAAKTQRGHAQPGHRGQHAGHQHADQRQAFAPGDDARALRLVAAQARAPGLVDHADHAVAEVGDGQHRRRTRPAARRVPSHGGKEQARESRAPARTAAPASAPARRCAASGANRRSTQRPISGSTTASSSRAPSSTAPSSASGTPKALA